MKRCIKNTEISLEVLSINPSVISYIINPTLDQQVVALSANPNCFFTYMDGVDIHNNLIELIISNHKTPILSEVIPYDIVNNLNKEQLIKFINVSWYNVSKLNLDNFILLFDYIIKLNSIMCNQECQKYIIKEYPECIDKLVYVDYSVFKEMIMDESIDSTSRKSLLRVFQDTNYINVGNEFIITVLEKYPYLVNELTDLNLECIDDLYYDRLKAIYGSKKKYTLLDRLKNIFKN